jgi:hypothetical protein
MCFHVNGIFCRFTMTDDRRYTSNEENILWNNNRTKFEEHYIFIESFTLKLVYWRSFLFHVWQKIILFIKHYILHMAYCLAVAPHFTFPTKQNISKSHLAATFTSETVLSLRTYVHFNGILPQKHELGHRRISLLFGKRRVVFSVQFDEVCSFIVRDKLLLILYKVFFSNHLCNYKFLQHCLLLSFFNPCKMHLSDVSKWRSFGIRALSTLDNVKVMKAMDEYSLKIQESGTNMNSQISHVWVL